MALYKIIVFFWIFLGPCGSLEALAAVSNRMEVKYTKKKEQKIRKRYLPKSGSPGMAYIYIFFFRAFGNRIYWFDIEPYFFLDDCRLDFWRNPCFTTSDSSFFSG